MRVWAGRVVLAILIGCLASSARADTIVMKNGTVHEGAIQKETPDSIVILVGAIEWSFKKADIASIERNKKVADKTRADAAARPKEAEKPVEPASTRPTTHYEQVLERRKKQQAKPPPKPDFKATQARHYEEARNERFKERENKDREWLEKLSGRRAIIWINQGSSDLHIVSAKLTRKGLDYIVREAVPNTGGDYGIKPGGPAVVQTSHGVYRGSEVDKIPPAL